MDSDLMKLTVKWPFNDIEMLPWDLSAFTFRMLPWDLSAFTFRMLPWDLSAFTFRMLPWDLAFPWDLVMFPWDPFHPPGFHFSRGGVPVTTRPSGFSAREQKRKTSVTLYFTQWRTKLQFLLRCAVRCRRDDAESEKNVKFYNKSEQTKCHFDPVSLLLKV
jgi:hypothetical protein